MTFLPVVERELRVSARKQGTYWNRFGAALVAIAVCAWVLLIERTASPDRVGRDLFQALSIVMYIYIPIAAALATSDSLTVEKRDGTLGLLFLTDLRSYDVIAGKLVSNSLAIVYRVLSVFPILGLCFLLGGVSNGEMLRTILVSVNLLLLSLTIGIFASAVSREGWAAIRLAMIILVVLLAVAPALAFFTHASGSSPLAKGLMACWIACGCITANDNVYKSEQTIFWVHAGLMQLLSWTFLWLACRTVPRSWQDRPVANESGIWLRLTGWFSLRPNAQERAAMLEQNPYLWRAKQRQTAAIQVWSALAVLALAWAIVQHYMGMRNALTTMVPLLLAHLIIKLIAAGEASRAIAEDRHSGAMELLLTTPLSPDQIIRGQSRAFFKLLVVPIGLVIAIDTISFLIGLKAMRGTDGDVFVALYLVSVGALILDVLAACWTGLWLGLSARSTLRAASGTIFRILLLPVLIYMLIMTLFMGRSGMSFGGVVFLWATVCFICDIFFMTKAQASLQGNFRSIAAGE